MNGSRVWKLRWLITGADTVRPEGGQLKSPSVHAAPWEGRGGGATDLQMQLSRGLWLLVLANQIGE